MKRDLRDCEGGGGRKLAQEEHCVSHSVCYLLSSLFPLHLERQIFLFQITSLYGRALLVVVFSAS